MWRKSILFLLATAVALPVAAQKVWDGEEEYNLYDQARTETDPARQVELLLAWESRYPNTDFVEVRLVMLADAYQSEGRFEDAFSRAARLFRLDPLFTTGTARLAAIAQLLDAPSPEQISIAEEAANELLRQVDNPPRREQAGLIREPPEDLPSPPDDAETENISGFLGQIRESHPIRYEAPPPTANGDRLRELADSTLAWVERVSK